MRKFSSLRWRIRGGKGWNRKKRFFSLDRKQTGINLHIVNWKYFLKNSALTAIHAHISLWNGIWTLAGEIINISFVSVIASNM
jgi:hypothetical protein